MGDPYVRAVGSVEEAEGFPVTIGVDYDSVTITHLGAPFRLTATQAEEFAQLFVRACWEAARTGGAHGWEPPGA